MGRDGGAAQGAEPVLLATRRLRLAPLEGADLGFVEELLADHSVRRFLGGPVEADRRADAAKRYLGADTGESIWCVRHKSSARPIGLVFLSNPQKARQTEVSYMFHPDVWGEGFAMEAVGRVLTHAFDVLRRPRVFALTQAANAPSRRLLERLGMAEEAREERFGVMQVVYGVKAAEYRPV